MVERLAMINSDGKVSPAIAAPVGISIHLEELRVRAFARTPYDHLLVEVGHVDAAERALAEGCDALVIDTFGDYAIDRIRAVAQVPVIGAGEAGVAEAAAGGRRFSIVTVWPESMRWLYTDRLARVTGGDLCGGVHFVGDESELDQLGTATGVKARMSRSEPATVDGIIEACRAAVAHDGTQAVLLGCTCMSPVAELIAAQCDFPVIDASAAGLRAAFDALERGDTAATVELSPRAGTIGRLVDAWLATDEIPIVDECEVCTLTPPQD